MTSLHPTRPAVTYLAIGLLAVLPAPDSGCYRPRPAVPGPRVRETSNHVIKCLTCGSENEAEAAFCGTCGAGLEPEAATPGPDSAVPEAKAPGTDASSSFAAAGAAGAVGAAGAGVAEPADAISETRMEVVHAAPPDLRKDPWTAAGGASSGSGSEEDGSACPTCGTVNPMSREFCRKCATELRPRAAIKRSRVNRGLVARFLVSAVVGTAVVVSGAFVLNRISPASATDLPSPNSVDLVDSSGVPVEFDVRPGEPEPLPALPATATIQLASYEEPAATEGPNGPTPGRAKWWSDALPRIPAVSQFDGGPLQKVNCVMASGAMLARLAFGIVTTGSQLRALSGDPDGGTSFRNLQDAVYRGWGVRFSMGALTPLQLRALLYAGAGAEIIVNYGAIPTSTRLQASFTGNHAIYIDAFSPDGLNGKPAYFVMDPIGRTWAGYKGGWWPAEEVERGGMAFGGGRVATTWAFAGGKVPFNHPRLPVSAYPANEVPPTSGPPPTRGPGQTDGPLPTAVPPADPMPTSDLPIDDDPVVGDPPPPDGPKFPTSEFFTKYFDIYPDGGGVSKCTVEPRPAGCPIGIVGIIDLLGGTIVSGTSPPRDIDLMYANPIAPDTYQIIYASPIDSASSLLLWQSSGGGTLEAAKVESGVLNGTEIKIATITLDPNVEYSFLATSELDGIRSTSDVGSLFLTP